MSQFDWKRAVTSEQFESRRSSILIAAWHLYRKKGVTDTSLNQIAKEAGLAKSNVYRYFQKREDIFLAMFLEVSEVWLAALLKFYETLPPKVEAEKLAKGFAKVTAAHKDFVLLNSLLPATLRPGSSKKELLRLHEFSERALTLHHEALNRIYRRTTFDDSRAFLSLMNAATSNFSASIRPSKLFKRTLHTDRKRNPKSDFEINLAEAAEIVILGLLNRKK